MKKKLHVLIVEDIPSDAELAEYELRTVLKNYTVQVVDTEEGFEQALETFKPDLIISDYKMPVFDGLHALIIKQEKSPFTPFVILTGSTNEDIAVECMKAGADDYVIKQHIKRLGLAALNAMEKKKNELERKQAEEALKKSEEKYRLLADNSIDAIWQIDLKLVFTYVSPSIKNILGYTVEECVGTRLSQHTSTKEFFNIARKALSAIKHYKKFKHLTFDVVMLHKDGTEIPVEITAKLLLNKKGLPIGFQGTTRDITERKRAEEEILKLSKVVETTPEAVVITDMQGNIEYVNRGLLTLGGFEDDNLIIGKSVFMFSNEKGVKQLQEEIIPTILSEGKWRGEVPVKRKDGSIFPAEMICSLIMDKEGNPKYLLSQYHDITNRKKAEEALQESEEQLAGIIDSITDHMSMMDEHHNIVWANDVAKQLFGLDLIGKKCYAVYHGRDQVCDPCIVTKTFADGKIHEHETEVIGVGGKKMNFWCTASVSARYEDGRPRLVVEVSRDITERKQAEDQIRRDLKEKELLLREVHHRVKNNLQVISGLLQLQESEITAKEDELKGFAASQDRIRAMAKAYELLLGSEYMSEVSVGKYIESLAEQLKYNYDVHHKVKISYSLEELTIGIEILDRLGLILNEIITNSIQYAFEGREVGNMHIELIDKKDSYVLKISDDGIGIPEDIDINNPDTLGLSLVNMLTTQLKGTLKLDRKNGTSFTLVLPKKLDEN